MNITSLHQNWYKREISFTLNGKKVCVCVTPNILLLDLLRDKMGLTGTKAGCREGECGACTVLLDGEAVNSCLVLAVSVEGKEVVTIEGLAGEDLDPIQRAFVEEGAVQCGYCTPGMVLSVKALLDREPEPTPEDIRVAMSGNLCRCTGYSAIFRAVERVARELKKGG